VVPTPGHVDGHQSLVVGLRRRARSCWRASRTTARRPWSDDALAARARELGHGEPLPTYSPWMERLLAFDPRRVVFAHDAAVWIPD
jgi:N-acyl homoserine lactone hydrolase